MSIWYAIWDALPFEMLHWDFMKNALLALLLMAPLFGILSTMIVTGRMSFFSDALGHSAFTGIAIGIICGVAAPIWAAVAFSVVFALLFSFVRSRSNQAADTLIGVFSSSAVALGIFVATVGGGSFTRYNKYLIGDILSVTTADLWLTGLLLAVTGIFFALFLPVIVAVSYDRDFAATQGLPVAAVELVMTALTALTIVACLRLVGIVLVISLLSVPQMTAALFVRTFRDMIGLSAVIAFAECCGGLLLSYYFNVPSGAAIILLSVSLYFLLRTIKRLRSR